MLPMLDLESLEGMSLAQVTTWTGRWVHTVTQQLRRRGLVAKPIIYTPFSLGSGFGCLLWVARYSDDFRAPVIPKPWRNAAIWQHSNGRYGPVKHVPGFGPVDVNAVHPDIPLSALRIKKVRKPAPPGPGRGLARAGEAGGRADDPGRSRSGRVPVDARSGRPDPVDVPDVPEPVDVPASRSRSTCRRSPARSTCPRSPSRSTCPTSPSRSTCRPPPADPARARRPPRPT